MLLDVWSAIGSQYIYMVNGFAGQVQRLDLNGTAAVGRTGKGEGEFGEAHLIAVSPKGEIWIADTMNSLATKIRQEITNANAGSIGQADSDESGI